VTVKNNGTNKEDTATTDDTGRFKVAVSSLFVPLFFTVTAAPGTTSLFGFVTTPPIAPVVVDCAKATALKLSTNKHKRTTFGVLSIRGTP
jgi:hypothetical protein